MRETTTTTPEPPDQIDRAFDPLVQLIERLAPAAEQAKTAVDQIREELAGTRELPAFVEDLLDLLDNPTDLVWHGRKGLKRECRFCGCRDYQHYKDCRWLAAWRRADELRARGVLPAKPAKVA